ncbi:MAG: hypothetical protein A4E28_01318 [Methanocella sp. PtaU1.Bin125]|nr:MAG: hypothetical protein A4E28_01318 [Methanocella sp. PtaU1.Bin125]
MVDITRDEYLEALERAGLTGHPGGIAGTRALIGRLGIRPGERVLDLGCGTGYTSCLMAREHRADVVAADLRPGMLAWARRRAEKERVTDAIRLVAADAHHLPFREWSFDAAVVESVLVFCDVPVALAELYRVLKPGGRLGCNELTVVGAEAREKMRRFTASFAIAPAVTTEDEWTAAFRAAGFTGVAADVRPIDWLDVSLLSPLRTDGLRKYLSVLLQSVTDPEFRKISRGKRAFLASGLLRHIRSGLYWASRP